MINLSIIIPSYNTEALLEKCLCTVILSMNHSTIHYEIIVVDNNSSDGSVEMVKKNFPNVIIIANKENVGYGRANNQGIKRAKGEYILLLNSDIEVIDDGIPKFLEFIRECNQNVKINSKFEIRNSKFIRGVFVGGKLLNPDLTPQSSAGPFFTLPIVFVMLFLKGDTIGISRYGPDTDREVDWVSGACLIGKKADFEKVGLFDESIFMYMDEIDLLFRAKRLGYGVVFHSSSRFIHKGAASSVGRKTPVVNIYRGLLNFYTRHMPAWQYGIVKSMLRWKAYLAIFIGRMLDKPALVSIYEEALRICQ